MTEGNTCYRGGKPGVSDVFAASLWAADYLLNLATNGYAGVNLHGGYPNMLPPRSAAISPATNRHRRPRRTRRLIPHPYYTPIAHIGDHYLLEPVAYGMLFANNFAGATTFPIDFNPGSVNATAYAATLPTGQRIVALINKDAHQSLTLDLPNYRQGPTFNRALAGLHARNPGRTLRQPRTLHPPPLHRSNPLRLPPLALNPDRQLDHGSSERRTRVRVVVLWSYVPCPRRGWVAHGRNPGTLSRRDLPRRQSKAISMGCRCILCRRTLLHWTVLPRLIRSRVPHS